MALSEFEKQRIDRLFSAFCENRIPPQFRSAIKIEFKIRGNEVKLYESRPHYQDPTKWFSTSVARFKKDPDTGLWHLYCADRNAKWHRFELAPPARDIEKLLAEVKQDRTGIFWG